MNDEPAFILSVAAPACRDAADCERTFVRAAEAGLAAVELSMGPSEGLAFDVAEQMCIDIGKQAARGGLKISAITVTEDWPASLASADDAVRQRSIDRVIAALDCAAWVGCDTVIISPGVVGDSASPVAAYEDVHALSLASLLALRFEAERRAVRIACRSHHARFLLSPLEMRGFLDECNSPWIGACLDLGAVAQGGGFPQDWIRSLGHRITQLRVAVAAADALDGSRFAAALVEVNYRGPVTGLGVHDDPAQARLHIERLIKSSAQ